VTSDTFPLAGATLCRLLLAQPAHAAPRARPGGVPAAGRCPREGRWGPRQQPRLPWLRGP